MKLGANLKIDIPELLAISGLFLCAVIAAKTQYQYLLILYLFFIPLLRREQTQTAFLNTFSGQFFEVSNLLLILLVLVCILIILLFNPGLIGFGLTTLFLVALPEEWFFRGYLQRSLGNNAAAIVIVSLLFSTTHGLTVSWSTAVLVFVPSLLFGYIYWKSESLGLVIGLHALANFMPRLI